MLEMKFEQSQEVTLHFFDQKRLDDNQSHLKPINKNLLGAAAVFCGTVGLHRYLLGHTSSGTIHLLFNILPAGLIAAGALIFDANIGGMMYQNAFYGLIVLAAGIVVELGHVAFTAVDGIVYFVNSSEKFSMKGGLRDDPSFCASFHKH